MITFYLFYVFFSREYEYSVADRWDFEVGKAGEGRRREAKTRRVYEQSNMAYIPPHKRHTNADGTEPSLSPSKLAPKGSLGSSNPHSPRNSKRRDQSGEKIIYAGDSISRWWLIGLSDDGRLPPSVELQPADCRLMELKRGEKPLAFRSKGGACGVLLAVFFFLAVEIDDLGFFFFFGWKVIRLRERNGHGCWSWRSRCRTLFRLRRM